jgi:ribonuclease-3
VLGLVATHHLSETFAARPEGERAKVRASVVSAAALAEIGAEIGLGDVLRLGKGEDASGGRSKPSILADAVEAVIGATYLDQGWAAARQLVLGWLADRIDRAAQGPGGHDYKTQLQELAAREFELLPVYDLRDEGPDHDKLFFAVVRLGDEPKGAGQGRSKKHAEQAAARAAWDVITAELAGTNRADRLGPSHPANQIFDEPAPAVAGRSRESEPDDA